MIYDCIIIGGGAAGLMCAATMPQPVRGLLLEKTPRAGTKLLMSGSGQCNITHAGSIKDFTPAYGPAGKKVRSCLYKYSNLELMDFMEAGGVPLVTREDGKVFPQSMDSHDVLYNFMRCAKKNGFEIEYNCSVEHIKQLDDGKWTVTAGSQDYTCRNLVIASGGCSYPTSGSDGSLFNVLSDDLGIIITELKPSLAPVKVAEYPYTELSGISFESPSVSFWDGDKKLIQYEDAVLFTHKDFSGPGILNISKYASVGCQMKINYVHPLNYEDVLSRLKIATANSKADMNNILASEFDLPKRFCQNLVSRYGEGLKNLAKALTGETFVVNSVAGFNKAMATAGGIELSQVKLQTMEFKSLPGLFAIGECLDVDGMTGGYNLQFCYSSARACGVRITELL